MQMSLLRELKTFGFGSTKISPLTGLVPVPAVELLDVGDDFAFVDVHGGQIFSRCILVEEFHGFLAALPEGALFFADGHGITALAVAGQRVTDQSIDGAHEALQLGLVLLAGVEQNFGAFAVISSDHNVHDSPRISGSLGC